jgi:hypothetical protein
MRHGTTSQQLGNVLSKDKDIVKVGYIKRSGILSGGYDIVEWATRTWVLDNCPDWEEGNPIPDEVLQGHSAWLKIEESEKIEWMTFFKSYSAQEGKDLSRKKEYFDIISTKVFNNEIPSEMIFKLISSIIRTVKWENCDGLLAISRKKIFDAERAKLDGLLPLAAAIKSKDLACLIWTLLGDLCKHYRVGDEENYYEKAEYIFKSLSNSDEDDDWMVVLS